MSSQLVLAALAVARPTQSPLPPAEQFHLIIREQAKSKLPLSPSCEGEASRSLLCRSFVVTLKNVGTHTVRIAGPKCSDPLIAVEMKPKHSGIGLSSHPTTCAPGDWTNFRLKPGKRIKYETRLISPRRTVEPVLFFKAGSYTLRANWTLLGCTEPTNGDDCLAPLQSVPKGGGEAPIIGQHPVHVFSNEIQAESPPFSDLSPLSFSFEVTAAESQSSPDLPANCHLNCTTFRYTIHNRGDRAIRNATSTCMGPVIGAEYRLEGSEWKAVPTAKNIMCQRNMTIETEILPGAAIENIFRLPSLGLDTSALNSPGTYQLRFTFFPSACIASPDGSFCLMRPQKQQPATSNIVVVQVPDPIVIGDSQKP
jgi:hypothetical protein